MLLSSSVVLADEPTAKLDPQTAKLIRLVLTEVAKQRLVIVATHDRQLIEAANQHYSLRPQPQSEQAVAA
jgi:ATP-binding cassette subfamily C protein